MGKLKLYSDFRDEYDHMFDTEGTPFIRFQRDFLSKKNQFDLLEKAGYLVPPHGLAKDLGQQYTHRHQKFVLYADSNAHAGSGKQLTTVTDSDRLDNYGNPVYASLFVGDLQEMPESYRVLNIGTRQFSLRYSSNDAWRSNVGPVQIDFLYEHTQFTKYASPLPARPLWAIDFVLSGSSYIEGVRIKGTEKVKVAIDLNTSPGIRYTGITKYISHAEIVDELKRFYENAIK